MLVSDGGDNCAPPDPCKAAAKVARGGVDLSISVVGLQVNPRVRRQLQCIADAGGGAYVDANDPDALRDELLAALARAFRSYDPTGTPVEGGAPPEEAPLIGEGQYLDRLAPGRRALLRGQLAPGQKLFASVSAIPDRDIGGSAPFRARLIAPDGKEGERDHGRAQRGPAGAVRDDLDLRAADARQAPAGAGVWKVGVQLEAGDLAVAEVPVELAVQTLDPNEAPGLARKPGAPGQPAPSATPSPSATPTPPVVGVDDGGGGAVLAVVGGGGLLAGLAGRLRGGPEAAVVRLRRRCSAAGLARAWRRRRSRSPPARRWSAAAPTTTHRCWTRAASATPCCRASGCSTASSSRPGSGCT